MSPRLSILIPTRNRLGFLRESLASARAQSLADIEILVSDDGSIDATQDYVREVSRTDPRVRLLTGNPVPGAFENINYLIAHATGFAVAVLGDDDILLPTFGQRLVEALDTARADVAYCLFEVMSEAGDALPRMTARLHRYHGFVGTRLASPDDRTQEAALAGQMWLGSCVYRREVIGRLGLDTSVGSAADWDLALRVAMQGRVVFVGEVLWRYRDHRGSISRTASAKATASAITVLRRYPSPSANAERMRLTRLRRLLVSQAWKSVGSDTQLARESLQNYDAIDGRLLEPRRLLTGVLLQVSPHRRAALHAAFTMAVERIRRLRA